MIRPVTQSDQSSFILLLTDGQQKVFSFVSLKKKTKKKNQPIKKESTDRWFLKHNLNCVFPHGAAVQPASYFLPLAMNCAYDLRL